MESLFGSTAKSTGYLSGRFPVISVNEFPPLSVRKTEAEVVSKNEYALFVQVEDLEIEAFLHSNDLTFLNNGEEELNKYRKGDKIKVKVLEIKTSEQKIRVGLRQTQKDPLDWFKDKKINQTTVKNATVVDYTNKTLTIQTKNPSWKNELNFMKTEIKKNFQHQKHQLKQ